MSHARSIQRHPRGFTLLELLVVVSIVLVLLGLVLFVGGKLGNQAREVTERNAARQSLIAWTNYALDHDGDLLPGYRSGLKAMTPDGAPISDATIGVAGNRYPWRLAPYLSFNFDILYVNDQQDYLKDLRLNDYGSYVYAVATFPSLGINSTWVGGDEVDGCFNPALTDMLGNFYASNLSQVRHPERLTVFASARGDTQPNGGGRSIEGYFKVASPTFASRRWKPEYDPEDSTSTGNVSARWNGRTVISRVDGSVDALPIEDLDDMRLWADRADSKDWVLSP